MEEPRDDLAVRMEQVSRARRRLAQSMAASGIAMRRDLDADRPGQEMAQEIWPHPIPAPQRVYPRLGAVLLTVAILLAGVIVQQRWTLPHTTHREVAAAAAPTVAAAAAESPKPIPVGDTVNEAPPGDPSVVRVRATRQCQVRTIVDGNALEWRTLQEGDEILARPRQHMTVESNDGGALSATVDGQPVSTGRDGEKISQRLK